MTLSNRFIAFDVETPNVSVKPYAHSENVVNMRYCSQKTSQIIERSRLNEGKISRRNTTGVVAANQSFGRKWVVTAGMVQRKWHSSEYLAVLDSKVT